MLIPGNTWQTVWSSAKAVPARRQKRLFDDTKEAEKVLHFFESQTLGSIGQLTIAPLFHSSFVKLSKESEHVKDFLPTYKDMEDKLKQSCCTLSREKWNTMKSLSKKKWEIVTNDISEMEMSINQARSLLKKLYPDKSELNDDVSFYLSIFIYV
jgi:Rab3 GTPase-activating protein catalytic subunit